MDAVDPVARDIALAISAGRLATQKDTVAAAVRDRYETLVRAIKRTSTKIRLGELEKDPTSDELRATLAQDLAEHGALKKRDVILTAKELLALIKVDDDARDAVDALLADVERALIALADVDPEEEPAKDASKDDEKEKEPKAEAKDERPKAPRSSARDLGSQRLIPPDEPSKTELERSALPVWKRTDRFFLKFGIVVAVYIVSTGIYWFFIRTPSDASLEQCRKGDREGCWHAVAAQDAVEDGAKVASEPLQILCEQHHDPCGCAGLAYVRSASGTGGDECSLIKQASASDPRWACTCTRYNFWRGGLQRTAHCGVPKCDSVTSD